MWDRELSETVSLVAGVVRGKALESALARVSGDLLQLGHEELERRSPPSRCDRLLKANFWYLTRKCIEDGGRFTAADLHRSICTHTHLRESVLRKPAKVAWLISGDPARQIPLSHLKGLVLERIWEILDAPLTKHGQFDHQRAATVLRIAEILLPHANGAHGGEEVRISAARE